MRLTNFLIEVGGFAQTGSAGAAEPRATMLAYSTASYADGIKSTDPHVFAFASFLEEGTETNVNTFLSGDQNMLRSDGSISFTGSLSALRPDPPGSTQTIRSNLLFIAETES